MNDLRFYLLLNSISVISGRRLGNNERLCAMEPRLRLKKFLPQAGLKPGTAKSADQRRPLSYGGLSPEKAQFVVRNAIMSHYEILGMPSFDAHVRRLSRTLSLHMLLESYSAKRLVYTIQVSSSF